MAGAFLRAEWRKLVMANYAVDGSILKKYLPYGTEIDLWNNVCYVSLVGFMFMNTRVLGLRVPFHANFEEVNLRFYVRYKGQGQWKRGVVFIKELVPLPALTWIANSVYGEHYETLAMSHAWMATDSFLHVEYAWKKGNWNTLAVKAGKDPQKIFPGSEEEFITEHYWGYTRLGDHSTSEYGVEHPTWEVYPIKDYSIDVDFGSVYGREFGFLHREVPLSVFLAEGSEIIVRKGTVLR